MPGHSDVRHVTDDPSDNYMGPGHLAAWCNYTCPHCSEGVNGAVLAYTTNGSGLTLIRWLRCPSCGEGAVMDDRGRVSPPAPAGPSLQGLPADVDEAYSEARRCFSVAAYTGTELVCRKLLMHVAVEKGATEGETFQSYVDHLESEGYLGPHMKPWVDQIRKHGNMATHELPTPSKKRAESTLTFTAQLLRMVYEMPYLHGMLSDDAPEYDAEPGQGRSGMRLL